MQLHQSDSVFRHNITTPLIVEHTLQSAMYSTDGEDIRLIKVWDGLGVLAFAVLNDEIQRGVVGVYRKRSTGASVSTRVSAIKSNRYSRRAAIPRTRSQMSIMYGASLAMACDESVH